MPSCSVRSSASVIGDACRAPSSAAPLRCSRNRTPSTSGAARNCSLAAATASRRVGLCETPAEMRGSRSRAPPEQRPFRKNDRSRTAARTPAASPSRRCGIGSWCFTSSQKFTSSQEAASVPRSTVSFSASIRNYLHCTTAAQNRWYQKCFLKGRLPFPLAAPLPYNLEAMLVELMVENYAVIEQVRVRFHRGLNLLTGETGSGKSIVVDALALLLGGRASAEMVRAGAERARISGIFEVARSARTAGSGVGAGSRDELNCWSSARSWPTANRAPSSATVP